MRYKLPEAPTNIEKVLSGLLEEKDPQFFTVDKADESISIFLGGWNLRLKANGRWEIE